MLGRETKLGARLECMAGLSGRADSRSEIETVGLAAGRFMRDRQLRGDTTPRIEAGCDQLRTVRARDCDCVHPVRAPDPEIRPAYPSRQQPRLHRRTDTEDKNLL